MKKKALYLTAIVIIGAMLLTALTAGGINLIQRMTLKSQTDTISKALPGTWFNDAFHGNGGKWIYFEDNGVYSLYQEISAADGQTVHQSSDNYGTSTWKVLSPTKLQVTVTTMGQSISEEVGIELPDENTLILDGEKYIRQP